MSKKNSNKGFSSRIGFLLATMGCAIGLGNIWRFPAQVNTYGGGSFLLLYTLFSIFLGYPLVLAKLAWGRAKRKSLAGIYTEHPRWQWLGFLATLGAFLTYVFYVVIAGQVLGYAWESLTGNLLIQKDFEAFYHTTTHNAPYGLFCLFLILLATATINRAGIGNGIERASKILMPLFMALLITLIVYAWQLKNAHEGIKIFLTPNWEHMRHQAGAAFLAALGQSFLSLSIGGGQLIIYGSYVDKKDNLPLSAAMIVFSDTLVALLAGFFIFPCLASMQASSANASGPQLAFVVLPYLFAQWSSWGIFIGTLFFLLLTFAAITSCISLLEVPSTYVAERWKLSRSHSIYLISLITFMMSGLCVLDYAGLTPWSNNKEGASVLQLIGDFTVDYLLTCSAFFFSCFIFFAWKIPSLCQAVGIRKESLLGKVLYILYACIIPLLIGISFLGGIYHFFFQ